MIERRRHKRADVNFWASLKHPLLGTITCEIQDMSISGVSIKLDEDMNFFVMMELDVRIHGTGWDETMPAIPVNVVRVREKEVALQFVDSCEEVWSPAEEECGFTSEELELSFNPSMERLSEPV